MDQFLEEKDLTGRKDIVIKMDVEGFEDKVFKGSCETIKQFKPAIIFEDSKKKIIRKDSKIYKFLSDLSYVFYEIHHDRLVPLSDKNDTYNFLAVPIEK